MRATPFVGRFRRGSFSQSRNCRSCTLCAQVVHTFCLRGVSFCGPFLSERGCLKSGLAPLWALINPSKFWNTHLLLPDYPSGAGCHIPGVEAQTVMIARGYCCTCVRHGCITVVIITDVLGSTADRLAIMKQCLSLACDIRHMRSCRTISPGAIPGNLQVDCIANDCDRLHCLGNSAACPPRLRLGGISC